MYINKQMLSEIMQFEHIVCEEKTLKDETANVFEYIRELIKLGKSYAHLQENACNYGLTPRQESREANIEKRITVIVSELGLAGVEFNGDPRGCTVKIKLPSGKSNHWGGETWGVPLS